MKMPTKSQLFWTTFFGSTGSTTAHCLLVSSNRRYMQLSCNAESRRILMLKWLVVLDAEWQALGLWESWWDTLSSTQNISLSTDCLVIIFCINVHQYAYLFAVLFYLPIGLFKWPNNTLILGTCLPNMPVANARTSECATSGPYSSHNVPPKDNHNVLKHFFFENLF